MQGMRTDKRVIGFFMLPALMLFLGIMAFPLLCTLGMSFAKWDVGGFRKFLGLANYVRMFTTDSVLGVAMRNTFVITGLCLVIQIPTAVLLAYLLRGKVQGKVLYRAAFFTPNMISSAAIGLLWMFIFYPDFGLVNSLLKTMGLSDWTRVWLGDENTALFCVILATCWQYIGYHMIIHLCAMEDIPASITEAAQIDGATSWDMFWRIILPNMVRIIKVDMVLVATGSLRIFDLIYSMTEGGPNHATEVLASHLYTRTFKGLQFGYGSALAVMLMGICLLTTTVLNLVFRRMEDLT